jgi:hypothetical protein
VNGLEQQVKRGHQGDRRQKGAYQQGEKTGLAAREAIAGESVGHAGAKPDGQQGSASSDEQAVFQQPEKG